MMFAFRGIQELQESLSQSDGFNFRLEVGDGLTGEPADAGYRLFRFPGETLGRDKSPPLRVLFVVQLGVDTED